MKSGNHIQLSERFTLNDDGTREDAQENTFNSEGFESSAVTYDWTYDADGRLTGESTSVDTGPVTPYSDTFAYDLEGNRMQEQIEGGNTVSGGSTVTYTYNGDNQLQTQTEHTHGQTGAVYQTTSTYDNDGNLITQTTTGSGAQSSTYSYDERNNMTSVANTVGSTTSTTDYTYDDNGVLTSETTNAGTDSAATTYYLNDPLNLTGTTKAIQQSSTLGGAPTLSFVFGSDVIAQTDAANGTLYLIHDGHGSTRALINTSGVIIQTYDYDAWGDPLDFNPATALTPWLFGGDGTYDPASGFVYQLARWREGLYFTQRDTYEGKNQDPLSLHRYLYTKANPVMGSDPSGRSDADSDDTNSNNENDDLDSGDLADQAFGTAIEVEADDIFSLADVDQFASEGAHEVAAVRDFEFEADDFLQDKADANPISLLTGLLRVSAGGGSAVEEVEELFEGFISNFESLEGSGLPYLFNVILEYSLEELLPSA